jgi:hypothetical protein
MKTRITFMAVAGIVMATVLALMVGRAWANWDPPINPDADEDGLPDAWEIQYFGDLGQNGSGDYDGDWVSNLEEYQLGRNPAADAVADTGGVVRLMTYTPLR